MTLLAESGVARTAEPPMKKSQLVILYVLAAGLLALWMWGGFDPVVPK